MALPTRWQLTHFAPEPESKESESVESNLCPADNLAITAPCIPQLGLWSSSEDSA